MSIIVFAVGILSCKKRCVPRELSFTGGGSTVFPAKDSIQIGDTLWLNSYLPLNYKYKAVNGDSISYNFEGAENLITDIHLTELLGLNKQSGAVDSFTFLPTDKGIIQNNPLAGNAAKTINYAYSGSMYGFSIGIIAKKKGIYSLVVIDIYEARKNCDKISIEIKNDNLDNHLHYLQDIFYGGSPAYEIDVTHSYSFKVY